MQRIKFGAVHIGSKCQTEWHDEYVDIQSMSFEDYPQETINNLKN